MNLNAIELLDDTRCMEMEATLVELIYQFNARATGHVDGRLLGGEIRTEGGDLAGGFSGHTWGGVSVVTHLWVAEQFRGMGVGRALLESAEGEARQRKCTHAILMTHDFQAPGFYERAGYTRVFEVQDWPASHANILYRKRIDGARGST
jgi:ribosomal protein S18 acetylase RimI-like enzyme